MTTGHFISFPSYRCSATKKQALCQFEVADVWFSNSRTWLVSRLGCSLSGEKLYKGLVCANCNRVVGPELKQQLSNDRPSWDEVWMDMAYSVQRRSYDPRLKVGCVIVPNDNTRVLAIGYNGNASGLPNVVDSPEPGKSGFIHAEQNALYKLDYRDPSRKVMYLTNSPCDMCAKGIIQCGVNEVVYDVEYRETSGLDILRQGRVKVRQYSRPKV